MNETLLASVASEQNPTVAVQWAVEPASVQYAYAYYDNVRTSGTVARAIGRGSQSEFVNPLIFDPVLANQGELLVSVATTGDFGVYTTTGNLVQQIEVGSSSVLSVATLTGTGNFEGVDRTFTPGQPVGGQSAIAVVFSPR